MKKTLEKPGFLLAYPSFQLTGIYFGLIIGKCPMFKPYAWVYEEGVQQYRLLYKKTFSPDETMFKLANPPEGLTWANFGPKMASEEDLREIEKTLFFMPFTPRSGERFYALSGDEISVVPVGEFSHKGVFHSGDSPLIPFENTHEGHCAFLEKN